jgi:hypothetical protein
MLEGPARFEADEQGLARREPTAQVEHAAQAAAGEVLGDEVGGAVVLAPVVDGEDVGVVQGGGSLGLGAEPADEALVVGEGGVEELDRDPSPQAGVVGEQHLGRRARPDGRHEAIAAAEDAADELAEPGDGHGPPG